MGLIFPTSYTDPIQDRIDRIANWIRYGTAFPGPYDLVDLVAAEERATYLAQAAYDLELQQAGATPPPTVRAPDWTCGCGATLHGDESSCWRCGAPKRP